VQAPTEESPTEKLASARKLSWRVVKSLQHDTGAFLQGLLWDNGGFYESTGLEGRSSLRRLAADGRVQKQVALPPEVFGEGLSAWKDSLIQISWKDGRAWRWDKATFAPRGEWKYKGEGWGITNDGRELIMSDGSDTLFFRDPSTFAVKHAVRVTFNGRPVRNLNELEFIQGRVWANIWQTDTILLIDPKTGVATGYLDLAGILPSSVRTGQEDVLNGIAYDTATKRIWVSGKQWPRIFQVQVEGQN
jgi:glutamine cyclotransferase